MTKYGMLYDDYKAAGLRKFTKCAELLQRNLTILCMILIWNPFYQSSLYLIFNTLFLAWNLYLLPYKSPFMQITVIINCIALIFNSFAALKMSQRIDSLILSSCATFIMDVIICAAAISLLMSITECIFMKLQAWKEAKEKEIMALNKNFQSEAAKNLKVQSLEEDKNKTGSIPGAVDENDITANVKE